jgi:hypothetical protein
MLAVEENVMDHTPPQRPAAIHDHPEAVSASLSGPSPATAKSGLRRLGPGRWRASLPRRREGASLEIYVCDAPPACLVVWVGGRSWEVLAHGDLEGAAALNLGDCLLGAVTAGAKRVLLRLGRRETVPLEAEAVVESFGRQLARGLFRCRLRLAGSGPGRDALIRALERGEALSTVPARS